MKNTLTFVQFYKANLERREVLTKRFNFKSAAELMQYLKNYGSVTLGATKTITVNSYDAFNKLSRKMQLELALKAGYSTIAAYMSKLRSQFKVNSGTVSANNGTVTATNTPVKETKILNVFILDESSSMEGSKANSMLQGVKEVISDLKQHESNTKGLLYEASIVSFSSSVDNIEINKLANISVHSRIRGGMTALHDAVGKVLNHLIDNSAYKDYKKVVQIFTDGGENCSSKFSSSQVARMIKTAEAQDITVTFMGTKSDVGEVKRMYALREGNSIVHENTADSIGQTFRSASAATVAYSKSVIAGEDVSKNFYSKVLLDK